MQDVLILVITINLYFYTTMLKALFCFQVYHSLNQHLYTYIIVSVHLCRTPLACHFDCVSIEHLQYVIFCWLLCNKWLVNIDCDSRILLSEFGYILQVELYGYFLRKKKNMYRMFIEKFNFRRKKKKLRNTIKTMSRIQLYHLHNNRS